MSDDEAISKPCPKQAHADYMRAYSRARGAVAVKGVIIQCARCGIQTEKQHRSHDWCRACVKPGQNERRRVKRAASGYEVVGTPKVCGHCGAGFTKTHKRQNYCLPRSDLATRDILPTYQERKRVYAAGYQKKRRKDPAVAISQRMSANMSQSLRDGKGGRKWESLVGYTVQELMRHLERQFLPGMTWENRSEWHVDHIRPLSSFNYTSPADDDFKAAWALTNLRPLWAKDNLRKHARRTHLI